MDTNSQIVLDLTMMFRLARRYRYFDLSDLIAEKLSTFGVDIRADIREQLGPLR